MLTQDCLLSTLTTDVEKIYIAYSGGVDSHVLLHLCCSIAEYKAKVTAVYIHHGLQQEADEWALHCQSVAAELEIDFKCLKVNVQKQSGQSLEEVARDARYQAFKPLLAKNDVLLLAQHSDDQLETVLLQLFRGAGVQGLSGMPMSIPFGRGVMCRPLLDTSKQLINRYAKQHDLLWIEDSSNQDNGFDRNFLRNAILPQLRQRWPSLAKTVSRSARHCASSHQFNQQWVIKLFNSLCDEIDQTLHLPKLLALQSDEQSLVIRQWFALHKLRMPSETQMERVLNEVCKAKEDRNPEVQGKGFYIRRYREKLYCLKAIDKQQELQDQLWPAQKKSLVLNNGLQLKLMEVAQGISKERWLSALVEVRFRNGAEKIRLQGREGHHSLKKIFQEQGIPPWERASIPLVYLDEKLAVVVGVAISADFLNNNNSECYQIVTSESSE